MRARSLVFCGDWNLEPPALDAMRQRLQPSPGAAFARLMAAPERWRHTNEARGGLGDSDVAQSALLAGRTGLQSCQPGGVPAKRRGCSDNAEQSVVERNSSERSKLQLSRAEQSAAISAVIKKATSYARGASPHEDTRR